MAQNDLLERLSSLKSLEDLKTICSSLNYEYANAPLATRDWTQKSREGLKEAVILARHQDFHVLYFKLDRLLLTFERNVLTQVFKDHPYFLAAFSDPQGKLWHFVNVKYDPDDIKRRLFRRIVVGPGERLHTAAERLSLIEITDEAISPLELQIKHDEAFDVEAVTKKFFETYKSILDNLIEELLHQKPERTKKEAQAFAQQFLNRLMFLYFIQKKDWLKWGDSIPDKHYMPNLFGKYKNFAKSTATDDDEFYRYWLSGLFFQAFNKSFGFMNFNLPQEVKSSFALMPFLNGGLFLKNEIDELGFTISDRSFNHILHSLLEKFNFTVREDTPLDVEVAVDPEMLGKVYESLVFEEERHQAGIFYTPRVEIDLMCRLSLIEWLFSELSLDKEKLIDFVMDSENTEILVPFDIEDLRRIQSALMRVKIVDPAVGSGSFLVQMMNVLVSLQERIAEVLRGTINKFALKRRIISENLFGVDVMDWAVRVAELRLWLSLIIESEEQEMDIYTQPLLPNLSFKVLQGDSLVEEIRGMSFSLRSEFGIISPRIKSKITKLAGQKAAYFRGDASVTQHDVQFLEGQILREIINEKTETLSQEIRKLEALDREAFVEQLEMIRKTPEQAKLLAEEEEKEQKLRKEKIEGLRNEREKLDRVLEALGQKKTKDYFLWDIDFADVFQENRGFDIVIANPPYVRQEEIAPPLEKAESYPAEEFRELKKAYKDALERSVKIHWQNKAKIDRKSDYYIYFYYHGLALLKPGGIFCFINSNSWLDVGYGGKLQEFLLKNMEVKTVIDNQVKRSFKAADVNTVIVLIKKPSEKVTEGSVPSHIAKNVVKFVALKAPFEDVSNSDVFKEIEPAKDVVKGTGFRVYPITQEELFKDALETKTEEEKLDVNIWLKGRYEANKWGGKFLRAPDIFFTIMEKGKGKLVRLGDIAEVRFGIKTGANEFFYLPSKHFDLQHDPMAGLYHLIPKHPGLPDDLAIEEEFLKPVIKSPKECNSIFVPPESLRTKVLICNLPKNQLREKKILSYITWGETLTTQGRQKQSAGQKLCEVATVSSRQNWYSLNLKRPPGFFCNRFFNDRFFFCYSEDIVEDQTFYGGVFKLSAKDHLTQLALLNSTISYLFTELMGRIVLGEGVLQYAVYEMQDITTINASQIPIDYRSKIEMAFKKLASRTIKSIYEEIKQDDRRQLDGLIFQIFGIPYSSLQELYNGISWLVRDRILKAQSV